MSTRSAVIYRDLEDGLYRGIYVHFDGYHDGVGDTLVKHFDSYEDAKAVVALGNCSVIAGATKLSEIEAYSRDRSENYEYNKPLVGETIEEVESRIGHNGFVYVFENGAWFDWADTRERYSYLDDDEYEPWEPYPDMEISIFT